MMNSRDYLLEAKCDLAFLESIKANSGKAMMHSDESVRFESITKVYSDMCALIETKKQEILKIQSYRNKNEDCR